MSEERNVMTVLYADDDADDRELFTALIAELSPETQVVLAADGSEVMPRLEKMDRMPNVIILDMNMPRMTGMACLVELRNDVRFRSVPVVMYSTTSHQETMRSAFQRGASDFRIKATSYTAVKTTLTDMLLSYGLM